MPVDLRQLRYFVAVAEERHITRAAERLGMQQPPLSQQIAAMERQLGVQLFHRKARGVELTAAGQTLFGEARAILARLSAAKEKTQRVARGEQGHLCLGVAPTAAFHPIVLRAIHAFRAAFPLSSLTLEEALSDAVFTRMEADQMDIAFIRTSAVDAKLFAARHLLDEETLVALPVRHALAEGEAPVSIEQLSGETFVLYGPRGTGFYDSTVAACRAAGFEPRIGQLTPRFTSALGLVAAGFGVSLVPACLRNMPLTGVAYRNLAGRSKPKAVLNIVTRRHDSSPVVRNFLAAAIEAAKGFGEGQ